MRGATNDSDVHHRREPVNGRGPGHRVGGHHRHDIDCPDNYRTDHDDNLGAGHDPADGPGGDPSNGDRRRHRYGHGAGAGHRGASDHGSATTVSRGSAHR